MKSAIAFALALAVAAPAVTIPVSADAQISTGRFNNHGARRALSEQDSRRLNSAYDEVMEREERVNALTSARDSGASLTPAQQAALDSDVRRLEAAQATIERLEEKKARRSANN